MKKIVSPSSSIYSPLADASSLSLLTFILTSEATSSTYTIPLPVHLVIITTILVHPSITNTSICTQASQLLTRVLEVTTPFTAKFDQVWNFSLNRKQHGEHGNS